MRRRGRLPRQSSALTMDSEDDTLLVPVDPSTRVGELGIGSFLILVGGVIWFLSLFLIGDAIIPNQSNRFNVKLILTGIYTTLILFLVNAERRSKWEEQGATSDDVDTLWLIHIFIGSTIAVGCSFGLLAVFQFDYCSTVVAKEIFSDDDRHVVRDGRAKKKFLF